MWFKARGMSKVLNFQKDLWRGSSTAQCWEQDQAFPAQCVHMVWQLSLQHRWPCSKGLACRTRCCAFRLSVIDWVMRLRRWWKCCSLLWGLQRQNFYSVSHVEDLTLQSWESAISFSLSPLPHSPPKIADYSMMTLEFKTQDLLCCEIENDNTKRRQGIAYIYQKPSYNHLRLLAGWHDWLAQAVLLIKIISFWQNFNRSSPNSYIPFPKQFWNTLAISRALLELDQHRLSCHFFEINYWCTIIQSAR